MIFPNDKKTYINLDLIQVIQYEKVDKNIFSAGELLRIGVKQEWRKVGEYRGIQSMDDKFKQHNLYRLGSSNYYINPTKVKKYTVENAKNVGEGYYVFEMESTVEIGVYLSFTNFQYFYSEHLNHMTLIKGY